MGGPRTCARSSDSCPLWSSRECCCQQCVGACMARVRDHAAGPASCLRPACWRPRIPPADHSCGGASSWAPEPCRARPSRPLVILEVFRSSFAFSQSPQDVFAVTLECVIGLNILGAGQLTSPLHVNIQCTLRTLKIHQVQMGHPKSSAPLFPQKSFASSTSRVTFT